MAKYTITIRTLIDNNFDFGLNDYPIWNEEYREILNQKILNHYFEYEIGFETPALFKHYLNAKMYEIMPAYNAGYEAINEAMKNPLGNINITETMDKEGTSTGTQEGESESKSKNLYQDTPQGQLKNTDIDNQTYATNLTLEKNNGTTKSTGTGETTEDYTKKTEGNTGRLYNFEVAERLKNGLINIDMMIIDELEPLFMGVF